MPEQPYDTETINSLMMQLRPELIKLVQAGHGEVKVIMVDKKSFDVIPSIRQRITVK